MYFKVKVFEQASRLENMILTLLPQQKPSILDVANQILGKSIFTSWPHLTEALVISVSDVKKKISIVSGDHKKLENGSLNYNVEDMDDKSVMYWNSQRKTIIEK